MANEEAQTFISKTENRDGDAVDGEYSYVDPLGHLITVVYTANAEDGYSETRSVQENFIQIRAKPVTRVVEQVPAAVPSSDLVARIIARLTPFIKETVATTLTARQPT